MSYKDIVAIFELDNLLTLDISEVTSIQGGSAKWNVRGSRGSDSFSNNTMYLIPNLPLKTLKLALEQRIDFYGPGDFILDDLYFQGEDVTSLLYGSDIKVRNIHWKVPAKTEVPDYMYTEEPSIGKSQQYDSYNKPIEYKSQSQIKIDNLYLDNIDCLKYHSLERLNPECVIFGDGTKMLVEYRGSEKNVDLSQYDALADYAFANSDIESVNLGQNIKEISNGCFFGCESLTSIQGLENIEKVGIYAFSKVPVPSMYFSDKLSSIHSASFYDSGVKEIEVDTKYPPQIIGRYDIGNISFTIPQGSIANYQIGAWKELNVIEKGAFSTFSFSVEKPGELGRYINNENAPSIQTLSITGIIDDLDFKYIRMCKNLKVLDLTNCYPLKSVETEKSEQAYQDFFSLLFDLAAEDAKHKYEEGAGSLKEAVSTTFTSQLMKAAKESDVDVSSEDLKCFMDTHALEGINYLQEIRFPSQLEDVDVILPTTVTKIVLPQTIKQLARIENLTLDELVLPESLEAIGHSCFMGSTIKLLDMKNTKVTEFPSHSFESCNIGILKAPKGLVDLNNANSRLSLRNGKIGACYFYSKEQPKNFWMAKDYKNCHILKGSKAGWQEENVIDDIIE